MAKQTARRVLLVDPDERFGALFTSYLETQGWAASWRADGRMALADWREIRPEMVVTDVQGQGLDGFEFIERLRRLAPAVPVVICTRQAGVQNWSDEVFSSLGVQGVLVRPVRFGQAEWMLSQILDGPEGATDSLRFDRRG